MAQAERRAEVVWDGDLMRGSGRLNLASSGALSESAVTWASRTEQADGRTSPEELLAGAHASCYAMAFAATLARAGSPPEQLRVSAVCTLDRRPEGGFKVTSMTLTVRGRVPGIDDARFREIAAQAEQGCPISNALRGNVEITVDAALAG